VIISYFVAPELPDIPRLLTGIAEFIGCVTYILLRTKQRPLKELVPIIFLGLGVLIGIQLFAGTLPTIFWIPGMALAVAAMFVFIIIAANTTYRNGIYYTARAFVLAELIASLHWQVHLFIFADFEYSLFPQVIFGVASYLLMFGAALTLERRHVRSSPTHRINLRDMASAASIALATFAIANLSFVDARTPFTGNFGGDILWIRTLVCLCGFIALYAQHGQRLHSYALADVARIDSLFQAQHSQYLAEKRNIETVNRRAHDLKHQIRLIRAESDCQKRDSYIDELEASIEKYDEHKETGNAVLDVVLTSKAREFAEADIDFTCVVDGQALEFMDTMDLAALFGNALDNAGEAVSNVVEADERIVNLSTFVRDGFAIATFENSFAGNLEYDGTVLATTKADKDSHGFGLRSISHTAEKYGGTASIQTEDGWFTLRVLIPVPPT
jgi:hypothetical protein